MALTLLRVFAWLSLVAILAATISPIGMRPVSGIPVDLERFMAFLFIGVMFGLAYPRHRLMVVMLVTLSAALFEMAQLVVPGRHGEFADFVIKAIGGGLGAIAGAFASRAFRLR